LLKIRIIAVGKDKDRWLSEGCGHFAKLLSRFAVVEWKIIAAPKATSSLPATDIKRREGDALLKEFGKGFCVALADKGEPLDSEAFARRLEAFQTRSGGVLSFLIGGPWGLDDRVLRRADAVISLSPLTFSHQLVRLVLLEQLYRAFSILHGTDYHK
jgi:23S rRNA (pseudouridine1915-N3)-methyltransferase